MTQKHDGGPTFPQGKQQKAGELSVTNSEGGMTMRDWFAGQALNGIISHPTNVDNEGGRVFAKCAYLIADAMLRERMK